MVIVFLLLRCIPAATQRRLRVRFWQQNPLSAEDRRASGNYTVRIMSLRSKFMLLVTVGMFLVAVLTTLLGYQMYRKNMFDAQAEMGAGVARVVASSMDTDRVDE